MSQDGSSASTWTSSLPGGFGKGEKGLSGVGTVTDAETFGAPHIVAPTKGPPLSAQLRLTFL